MIDVIVMALVIFLFQTPVFYLVHLRDKEIKRLNTALLRAERPTVAAVAERPAERKEREPLSEEEKLQLQARRNMFKV